MDINYLLIIFIVLMLFCVIRGAQRGMMRIIFSLVAWIFLICFVNIGGTYLSDYIKLNTEMPAYVQEMIDSHLHTKYEASEEKEEGTGRDAILSVVPEKIRDDIETSVQTSIDNTIRLISEELTDAAINGISTILIIVVGIILIILIDKIIRAIGFVPGIRDVNRMLGVIAGAAEGLLITWVAMYIANCFPTSVAGQFIITYTKADSILYFIYTNNVIERIIGK